MSENGHWRGPHMSAMLRLRADRRAGTPLASDKRMSVASIEKEDVVPPTSGSGMDRVVAKKGLPTRLKIAAGVVVVVALAAIFFWFAPRAGTPHVPADHVTISQIGRAHVCTPGPDAHLVCRLLLE